MNGLYRSFLADVADARLPAGPPGDGDPVTEGDLADLPAVARRYLRFMGVVGRRRDWSLMTRFSGRFRRRPDQPWMRCSAWQYNTSLEMARIFTMRVWFARVLPMIGHDTYVRGRGRMLGKVAGIVTVADGSGLEFDVGELTTYLTDAVLLAPSMLLGPNARWEEVDDRSFDIALTDAGRTVRARVFVDERGAPVDFATTDRYADLPGGLAQAKWTTPIRAWSFVDGRPLPGPAAATWHLPEGSFTYIEGGFVPGSVRYNLAPPG
jgi:hypothetical protein